MTALEEPADDDDAGDDGKLDAWQKFARDIAARRGVPQKKAVRLKLQGPQVRGSHARSGQSFGRGVVSCHRAGASLGASWQRPRAVRRFR